MRIDFLTSGMPASQQLPCHDPPVAWKVDGLTERYGLPVLACPAFAFGFGLVDTLGYLDPEPVILDSEPGRRP